MKFCLYFIIVIAIILNGCGKQGIEGKKSLIDMIPEAAGANCTNGGYKIVSGIDQNNNNILEQSEIQNTKYICNGIDGKNSLTTLYPEPAGDNCPTGGYLLKTGVDLNNNNVVDDNEIINSEYICNGLTGVNSIAEMVEEPAGEHCPTGGYKVKTGSDMNKNGQLDENEVQNTTYVCNGNNSLASLIPEPAGQNCNTGGYKINTGVDINGNKVLDENEIQNSQYICNGLKGNNSLVLMTPEPAAQNCSNGGFKAETGVDVNKNGILDEDEIQNTSYICNGTNGFHYLVAVKAEPGGDNCSYGGYSFQTGLDVNRNNVLEAEEVTRTVYLCNSSSVSEIRIPLEFSANTTSTTGVSGLALSNFNKANYIGFKSIVFAGRLYTTKADNNAIVNLVNLTDKIVITGSELRSNQTFEHSSVQYSENLYDALPSKTINIGMKVRSQKPGVFSAIYAGPYLILSSNNDEN